MDYRWHPSWGQTGPVDNRITDSRVPRRIRKKVEFYGQRRVNTGWGNISQANSRHLSVYKSRLCWKERDNHFQSTRKDKQDVISQQSAVMRHVKITYLHFMTKQPTRSKLCNTSSMFFFPWFSVASLPAAQPVRTSWLIFETYRSASFTSGRSIIMTLYLNPICCPTSQT